MLRKLKILFFGIGFLLAVVYVDAQQTPKPATIQVDLTKKNQ